MDIEDVLRLTARTTVARMLERDDFSKRYRDGVADLADGVPLPAAPGLGLGRGRADVELGGTDQLFNILMGRHLQEQEGQEPQVRAHHAAARGPRRRAEDVEVARQLRRDRRAAGRAVRQAHAHPRRADAAVLRSSPPAGTPDRVDEVTDAAGRRRAAAGRRPSGCWPGPSSTCTTATVRARRPRPSSTGCSRPTTVPERRRRAATGRRRRAPDGRSGCRGCAWPFPRLVPSNKEGRRKIEQGGVRLDGEVVTDPELEVDAGRGRRADCSRWASGTGPGRGPDHARRRQSRAR